jgi:uncharacterized membrane protein YjdF
VAEEAQLAPEPAVPDIGRRIHLLVVTVVMLIMTAELSVLVARERWMHVFLVLAVMTVILIPVFFRRRLPVEVPSEIQVAAVLFIFATLFLGEVRDYYERIWWWDLALHGTAGILLGLIGFLVVYVLNESELVEVHMKPAFVALFAFFFSLALGTLWELFEFGMDEIFGLTMQKPMAGDPSGLTDTMWDLIVDTIGAAAVSLAGWRYLKRTRRKRIDKWAKRYVERRPRLMGRKKVRQ